MVTSGMSGRQARRHQSYLKMTEILLRIKYGTKNILSLLKISSHCIGNVSCILLTHWMNQVLSLADNFINFLCIGMPVFVGLGTRGRCRNWSFQFGQVLS